MQMLKKLFSSENKYYLELKEEVQDSEVVQTAIKTAEKTAEVVKEKAQEVANSEPVQSAVKTASEVVDTAQDKVASAIATEEKSGKQTKVTEAKDSKAKAAQNGKTAVKAEPAAKNGRVKAEDNQNSKQEAKPAKSAAENAGASSFDPPFWVAAMNNTNNKAANGNGAVAEETFAENNLMPIVTKYRRRPGGSLDKFKDMAKSAKTPRR